MYRYVAVTHHHRFNNSDWSLLFDVSIEYNEKWLAEFFGGYRRQKMKSWRHFSDVCVVTTRLFVRHICTQKQIALEKLAEMARKKVIESGAQMENQFEIAT